MIQGLIPALTCPRKKIRQTISSFNSRPFPIRSVLEICRTRKSFSVLPIRIDSSLNAMIVPMIKDQGIQQGHREMAQNYQMQMELKELRSQQAQDASRDQQLKETMVEMLENKFKELTKSLPEKIREASGER